MKNFYSSIRLKGVTCQEYIRISMSECVKLHKGLYMLKIFSKCKWQEVSRC